MLPTPLSDDQAPASAAAGPQLPALIEEAGDQARRRFIEFFTAHIRNPNTRQAYARAVATFAAWAEAHGLALDVLEPVHVAAYIEELNQARSVATTKQHLAAIRALFDFLVVGQVIPFNPAHAVRGPALSRRTGTTPVISPEQARQLLDQPDSTTATGLRDRAMIAVMLYSSARVSAVVAMRVGDYYQEGERRMMRLREKGGKERSLPVHHEAAEYLDAWIAEAGIGQEKRQPLFPTFQPNGQLTSKAISRQSAYTLIRRHAEAIGLDSVPIGCHSMRATGVTTYLERGGGLETAQDIAGHADVKTTKLYDRRGGTIRQAEIERVQF